MSIKSIIVGIGMFMVSFACAPDKDQFVYHDNAAHLLKYYQSQMYYEYQSPLNDEMKFYLKLLASEQCDLPLNYESITKAIQRIQEEKPFKGCYYTVIPTNHALKELVILVKWCAENQVIVSVLTNTKELISVLP